MTYDFDEVIDRSRTNSAKWLHYDQDVLPMWVADCDFVSPEPVRRALRRYVEHGIYGYPYKAEGSFEQATVRWCHDRLLFDCQARDVEFVPSLTTALSLAVLAFTQPGENVLIQTPVYPPFKSVAVNNGRHSVTNPLINEGDGNWSIDWVDFEAKCADPKTTLFLLCNPQNPTGRVFTAEELERMVDLCHEHGVVIFSDEVHADFVYGGAVHISLPTLGEKARSLSVVGLNPSKTFNIAGLRAASVVIHNPELMRRYRRASARVDAGRNGPGVLAYTVAFTQCDDYVEAVRAYVEGNLRYAVRFINERIEGVTAYMPQATYLLWLDCRGLPVETQEELDDFMVSVAKVGMNSGLSFGEEGDRFLRLNVACPRSVLTEALERIERAVGALKA